MKLLDWIGFLSLVIALVILWQFRGILLLVFMAAVIAIALNSLVRWLQHCWPLKRPLSRGNAVSLALFLVILGGFVVAIAIFPPFISQVTDLVTLRVPEGIEAIRRATQTIDIQDPEWLQQWSDRFPFLQTDQLEESLQQVIPEVGDVINQVSRIVQDVFGNFLTFFSSTAAIALQVLLVVILTIMMLSDPAAYRSLLIRLFPSFYRRRADEILTKCEQILLGWMGGVCLSSIFVAIACGIGLLFLQVDLVFAHALLAGLFNIIPNIGPTLSLVFPVSVALIPSPGKILDLGKAIGVVILYLVVQNIESYWFSPMVMRQQVSLLPAATLIAQLFFALFLGPLGLVLALPLTVVSKVWIEEAFIVDVLDRWEPRRTSASEAAAAIAIEEIESGAIDSEQQVIVSTVDSFSTSLTGNDSRGADIPLKPDPTLTFPDDC